MSGWVFGIALGVALALGQGLGLIPTVVAVMLLIVGLAIVAAAWE